LNLLGFLENNDFYEESEVLSKYNFYSIYVEKKIGKYDLLLDVEKTLKNQNLVFLRYKIKNYIHEVENHSIFSKFSNFNLNEENNPNQNMYYFINSHVRELAKAFKYNIKINFSRMKDIITCEKNNYSLFIINTQFFEKIKDNSIIYFSNKNNPESSNITFKLFYDKIIFPILDNIPHFPNFYYPKIKFTLMLEDLILTTKNLIYKYYN
jgi:hypothetical protein